mmetsp:Transcript_2974/g.7593  ORF Transcript_2974/g.7593 Transcript_2974/m.7593 type:complete len:532 (+) Transcript_2974:70-1665(+)
MPAAVGVLGSAVLAESLAGQHLDHWHDTSFVDIAPALSEKLHHAIEGLRQGEAVVHQWVHDKLWGLEPGSVGSPVALPTQARMVEYIAKGCPHCKDMEPAWQGAVAQWGKLPPSQASQVVWQQKECFDKDWNPGTDNEECSAQGVDGFPTVHYYPPGSAEGLEFSGARSARNLVDFAQHPSTENDEPSIDTVAPQVPHEYMDMKMVDYYAAACPHCKHLEPEWDKAVVQWDKHLMKDVDAPFVSWEKKECFDSAWNPGKDAAECEKQGVDGFPTVRLFKVKPDTGVLEQHGTDYEGARKADALVDFVQKEGVAYAKQVDQHLESGKDPASSASQPIQTMPSLEEIKETGNEELKIVDYYADACPHCKTLQPVWKEALDKWHDQHPGAAVAWEQKQCLDSSWKPGKDYEECVKQEVTGFPTLRLFKRDADSGEFAKLTDFRGARTADALLDFMGKRLPSTPEVTAKVEATAATESGEPESEGLVAPMQLNVAKASMLLFPSCLPTPGTRKATRQVRCAPSNPEPPRTFKQFI